MRPKLLIWNAAWAPFAREFARRLAWDVEADTGTLEWLIDRLPQASALLATELLPEALPGAQRLRMFLYPGAGVADCDPAHYPHGCAVTNVFEHETPIAEYVIMTMLMHATRVLAQMAAFARGEWMGSGRKGGETHDELSGKTLGMLGHGRIGQAVAKRATAFGMATRAITSRNAGQLPAVLRASDYFLVAAPLTPQTRGLIGARELAMLPPHAFLLNVARAEIVDEHALYQALATGRLAGAALDVWYDYEGTGSRYHFQELPNVIATPHSSAWTKAMILRRIEAMVENLRRLEAGQPLERVIFEGTWR